MQTFLPFPSFVESAKVLDYRRLGKQRVEVLQILTALYGGSKGWVNHPCTKMWKGHEFQLISYGIAICQEWIQRGYKDTCADKIATFYIEGMDRSFPEWLGFEPLHLSHKSNLIRKMPEYYKNYFPNVRDDIPYIWHKP